MKILNIIEEGRFGGPQKRIAEVSNRLQKYGILTIVVVPNKNSEKTLRILNELNVDFKSIRLHRLTKDLGHLFGYLIFFIPEVLSLIRIIKEERIDIVHCNGSWQYKGMIAAKIVNVKSVWHLNDTSMPGYILNIFFF